MRNCPQCGEQERWCKCSVDVPDDDHTVAAVRRRKLEEGLRHEPRPEHSFTGKGGACAGCGRFVEECIDHRYCDSTTREARAARASFEEDHTLGGRSWGRDRGSQPTTEGADGRNWID
jgi:hypothetical protein